MAVSLKTIDRGQAGRPLNHSSHQATDDQAAVLDLLAELVAEQARQRETLALILRALERLHGPRDAADLAVLVTIAETIGDRRWTCSQLLAHADVSLLLRDALEAADIVDTRDLGWYCRRVHGHPRDEIRLERVGQSRAGLLWRVVVTGQ